MKIRNPIHWPKNASGLRTPQFRRNRFSPPEEENKHVANIRT